MNASIDISIAIVSYNTRDLLRACLRSLQTHSDAANLEIIVIDNASRDGSAHMVRQEFPDVQLIESAHNSGYGAANNRALQEARGEFVWILNSDTTIESATIATMLEWMRAQPRCGAIGTRLILPAGTTQPSCALDPSLFAVFIEQTYLDKLMPGNRYAGSYAMTDWDYNDLREVPQVCGASLLVRRAAWRALGGFDESYFMYFEDTDLCVRLREAGWKIWYLPAARVHHHLGASSAGAWRERARMVAHYNRGRLLFFGRRCGKIVARALQILMSFGALARLSFWLLRALMARKQTARRQFREQVKLFRLVWRDTKNADLDSLIQAPEAPDNK